MSLSLTNVEQEEFDAQVKIEYRSRGFILRDCVRTRTDITGATCQFRKVGEIVANETGFQQTVALQDPGYTRHTATLIKYTAPTAVDEIQDLTVNFDARQENAMIVAMAIGRRSDQIIINAVQAGAAGLEGTIIPAAGENMTYGKLRNVIQVFEENAVPIEERYISMSGSGLRSLLADDHLTSRFYTSNNAVATGTLNYRDVLGLNVRVIPNMVEGGLPLVGTVRRAMAWAKQSTGMAIGQDLRTEINYLPRETSYLVNGIFFAGAVAIDNRGIIRVDCDEAVNP